MSDPIEERQSLQQEPSSVAPSGQRSRVWPWFLVLIVLLMVVGGYAGWQTLRNHPAGVAAANTTTVTGTLELNDYETWRSGCVGQGGYSDVTEGTQVILYNQSSIILSSASLSTATPGPTLIPSIGAGLPAYGTKCTWTFTLTGVPEDQAQYAVEVSHRGKVVNSQQVMKASGWTFALKL